MAKPAATAQFGMQFQTCEGGNYSFLETPRHPFSSFIGIPGEAMLVVRSESGSAKDLHCQET